MKIFKWIVLAVVVLIIAIGGILYFSLDGIVRRTIQSQSQSSLNLPTQLAGANLSLLGGHLSLKDYQIANPSGFAGNLLSLDGLDVKVSYSQLVQTPVKIDSIALDGPTITLERSGTELNLQAAMNQMPKNDKPGQEPAKSEKPATPLKLIINHLTISNAKVVIKPNLPGLPEQYALTIPSVTLNNIGNSDDAQNGAAIKEVVMLLTTTLASRAADSDQLPPQLRQLLSTDLGQLTEAIQKQFSVQVSKITDDLAKKLPQGVGDALKEVVQDPKEALKDPGKAIEQGLGNLLDKSKKPDAVPANPPADKK